jgi:hypothetical protein
MARGRSGSRYGAAASGVGTLGRHDSIAERLDKALNIAGFRLLRRPSRQPRRAFLTALSERPQEGIFNSALQMLDLFLCCNSACSPHALQGRPSNRPRTAPRRLGY